MGIVEQDVAAGRAQPAGHRPADTAGTSGDEGNPPGQSEGGCFDGVDHRPHPCPATGSRSPPPPPPPPPPLPAVSPERCAAITPPRAPGPPPPARLEAR